MELIENSSISIKIIKDITKDVFRPEENDDIFLAVRILKINWFAKISFSNLLIMSIMATEFFAK